MKGTMKKQTRAETKKRNKKKAIEKIMDKYGLTRGDAEFWLDNGVPLQAKQDPAFNTLKPGRKKVNKLSTDAVFARAMKKRDDAWKEKQKKRKEKDKYKEVINE